ncbi:uncharacterized protein LOC116345099 isoform X2 [Contarinia nasturtii]|uniref:uncharacterized protein LOC116345099 isoform X2 n=1 Tax=Contarinia nasturtii TaxID=265458 RepID=UPI0012D4C156|nr:uncharacterized protein LOC116345099 isoform X2 [Contarinia nasturtii]
MQSLRGIFPRPKEPPKRDFIKENVKNLKLMQRRNHNPNQVSDTGDFEKKQRKIRSTSHSRLRLSSSNSVKNIAALSKSIENISNHGEKIRPLSVQSRDAYSQTESVDDELFLKDVIIRLPSASISKNKTNKSEITSEYECTRQHVDSEDQGDHVEKYQENVDGGETEEVLIQFDEQNKTKNSAARETLATEIDRPIHQFSTRCEHSLQICANDNSKPVVPSSYRKGEIPKYLKEMKFREEERSRLMSLVDVNCPPGHTVLTESERLESLNIAQKKYQDLIDELNHMSLTSKTLRIRNRQIEIEKELRQLDNSIQIFSRSKVYVKIED